MGCREHPQECFVANRTIATATESSATQTPAIAAASPPSSRFSDRCWSSARVSPAPRSSLALMSLILSLVASLFV